MERLQKRKEELAKQIGEDKIKKIKKFKLLKLLETQIQDLMHYWTLAQILHMINNEFELKISKTVFYDFCKKNLKKFEKIEIKKIVKEEEDVITIKKDIEEKQETSILDEDELSVVEMFNNSQKKD